MAQTQLRNRVWPTKLLVERDYELLVRFADRLGVSFYGPEWRADMLRELSKTPFPHPEAGTAHDCALMVWGQIWEGLRSGLLTACVQLTVAAYAEARREVSFEEMQEASPDELSHLFDRADDPLVGDDGAAKMRVFLIHQQFWTNVSSSEIDWRDSTALLLPIDSLVDPTAPAWRKDRRIEDIFNLPHPLRQVAIKVCHPDSVLRNLFSYNDPPGEDWLNRYKIYRVNGRLEAVAAAWRLLAISVKGGFTLPGAADLARQVDEYLTEQGYPSEGSSGTKGRRNTGLQEIAARVLEQFTSGNLNSSVLVSSNPRHRRPV